MKYLICGFSGAGKSSLLNKIKNDSQYKEYEFYDLDSELLKVFKKDSITELVESIGWEEFRQAEQETLNLLLQKSNIWIALGGGSLNEKNVDFFYESKDIKVLFLDTPIEVCLERIKAAGDRPLLAEGEDFLRNLYKSRLPIYTRFERILSN